MEPKSGNILFDPLGEAAAETALAQLREERWRLGWVQDEVELTSRRLAGQEVDAGWRSPAQRAYEGRLAELAGALQGAWRALDDALAAVGVGIDRVKATR
jgi:hypothetical protein